LSTIFTREEYLYPILVGEKNLSLMEYIAKLLGGGSAVIIIIQALHQVST
jgi:hypothetical protein